MRSESQGGPRRGGTPWWDSACALGNILEDSLEPLGPDYGRLLGWEFTEGGPMPDDLPGQYFVARIQGRDVAGIGSTPGRDGSPSAAWNTYVRVDSIEKTVEAAQRAGGRVLIVPLDALPAGRLAVLADLSGAAVGVWEPRAREGAQLVNEPGTWTMSSLHTDDTNRARAFYGAVFGWQATSGTHVVRWRRPAYVGGEPEQPFPRDIVAVMAPSDEAASTPQVPPHWNVNFAWMTPTPPRTTRPGLSAR